ncbi:MAG: putative PHP domain protein [Treponematales bacterium]
MYLYETHLHTSASSSCGLSRGGEYIKPYQDLGFSGVIITDHFYRGNCAVDKSLPWAKWVDGFVRGYEEARNEGARRGLDVFFGWEETYDGDDYLVYGLDREWLLEHPEARFWTRKQQFEAVDEAGGCVVQAHPFRMRYYIPRVSLAPAFVHGVEAANSGNGEDACDALALAYARRIGRAATAGSDMHSVNDVTAKSVFGVYLNRKMRSIADYVTAVRNNTIASLRTTVGRCELTGFEDLSLEVEVHDGRGKPSHTTLEALLGLEE